MSKKSTKPAGANIFAGAIEGLGDSVSAFFTDDEAQQFPVALDLIDMRPQIRTELEDEDNPLPELAASIKAVGVISPIFLRRKGERYELIAGERRVRAAQMAGLDAIPAMVRDLTDQQAEDIQAAENIQRKNLTNMELARRLQKDLEQLGSIDAVMAKRNKSRSWVSKILSLNKLPEQTQRLVTEGVTADLAIISDVRQIEARDPVAAKELVDDLKRNFGKGDSREKVQRVRAKIKPAANKAKAARHDLGELYAQARTGDAKAIAAALTPEQKKACEELREYFEQGCNAAKAGRAVFEGFDSRVFGTAGAGALRLAAFLRGVDAGQSGRFQLAEILRLVQSA